MQIHTSGGNLDIINELFSQVLKKLVELDKENKNNIPTPDNRIVQALFALIRKDFGSDTIDPLL